MKRPDDYDKRGAHLKELSDEQLHQRFWSLVGQLTDPLLATGRVNGGIHATLRAEAATRRYVVKPQVWNRLLAGPETRSEWPIYKYPPGRR